MLPNEHDQNYDLLKTELEVVKKDDKEYKVNSMLLFINFPWKTLYLIRVE